MKNYTAEGWIQLDMGGGKTQDYNDMFLLFKRQRKLEDVLPNQAKTLESLKSSKENECTCNEELTQKARNIGTFTTHQIAGSNVAMGGANSQTTLLTPDEDCLVRLSRFDDYESLLTLRSDSESLVIGFDSEWYSDPRKIISWQFALIFNGYIYEYVYIKRDIKSGVSQDLWIELALGKILDDLDFPRVNMEKATFYKCIDSINPKNSKPHICEVGKLEEIKEKAQYYFHKGEPTDIPIVDNSQFEDSDDYTRYLKDYKIKAENKISITLVGHTTKVDITTFNQEKKYRRQLLSSLKEAQGGLFSFCPIPMNVHSTKSGGYAYIYPVTLHVRDSLCSAPADKRKLEDLGKVIGVPKVEINNDMKRNMNILLKDNFPLFLNYASTDAVVTMLYTSAVYGVNRHQAVTVLSAGSKLIRESIAKYLGVGEDAAKFDAVYRGLCKKKRGKVKNSDGSGFKEVSSKEPVNDEAGLLQSIASEAYHGGYNSCSDVGFFRFTTYDYDIPNAYPTAMCLVPDVDWENCILDEFEKDHVLTMDDFKDDSGKVNVFPMMFAYVSFDFPKTVNYPCIPIDTGGVLIFPRSSAGLDGVYACGPELYLAVKLGAKVTVQRGYKVNVLRDGSGNPSHSLKYAVKQLVVDRNHAKEECGKGSIEELILKLIVNGGYGKVSQDVVPKSRWSAYTKEMESIGFSCITNPVSAAMITSIVRATLIAAQNQIFEMGYTTYSVTTDGFISNIPETILKSLDLFGMRDALGNARRYLTDDTDSAIWEIKHEQDDLLNITTRGNVSLITENKELGIKGGVCAHNSAKSGYESDSYKDRLWLMTKVLSRTGTIQCVEMVWTSFKDIVAGKPFTVRREVRNLHMDYDLKRKPVKESLTTIYPEIEGARYEIANFTTIPFDTVGEFLDYRKIKDTMDCLRTIEEWERFFGKLFLKDCGAKPRNMDFAILNSVIMGYRAGLWEIPALDEIACVEDKCNWINRFNNSARTFKVSDWKNARRPDRQKNILPESENRDLLGEMQSWVSDN